MSSLDQSTPLPEPGSEGVAGQRAERYTVLVVENDEQSRRLIEQILAFSQYACLSVANGLEALDALDQERIDLVLMDLSMPALDGYQTVERMRERRDLFSTPIVAVSGRTTSDERDLALQAGFTEYLSKPFRPKELLQLIDRLLSNVAREGGPD
jgi:CheY-like chemotaxis protein